MLRLGVPQCWRKTIVIPPLTIAGLADSYDEIITEEGQATGTVAALHIGSPAACKQVFGGAEPRLRRGVSHEGRQNEAGP